MLAPRTLPRDLEAWNRRHNAPWGRRGADRLTRVLGKTTALTAYYRGAFGWQPNNSTRIFEYPYAYSAIQRWKGRCDSCHVVELGGGLSGLQFVLANGGHRVTNVDPGPLAKGEKWALDISQHAMLAKVFNAPARLCQSTIGGASLADNSVDILLSISSIEHFTDHDLIELQTELPRVLSTDSVVILTIDLFLDVAPFTQQASNSAGRNIDVRQLLEGCGLTLVEGNPAELHGFEEFDPERIQTQLKRYLIGASYPALSQCLVARPS